LGWTDYVNQQRRPVEKYCNRVGLRELDQRLPDAWAKESYEIAVKRIPNGRNYCCRLR
jgi:Glycosyl transferase family 2